MTGELSSADLAWIICALLGAGLLTGFLSGLLGVGGGGILVPVLYELFTALGVDPAVRMHLALGTSMAVIVPTSLKSFAGHRARGAVDMAALYRLGPWIVLGVVIGALLAGFADATALKLVWIVFGSALALKMALGREDWRLGADLPRTPLFSAVPLIIGAVSTLMSIGGGAFMVTLLSLYGRSILTAVATSSGFGPLISIPGVIGYVWAGWNVPARPPFSFGYVDLLAVALLIPACFIAVPYGVRAAHGLPKRQLELAFAAFLTVVVTRFALSLGG